MGGLQGFTPFPVTLSAGLVDGDMSPRVLLQHHARPPVAVRVMDSNPLEP